MASLESIFSAIVSKTTKFGLKIQLKLNFTDKNQPLFTLWTSSYLYHVNLVPPQTSLGRWLKCEQCKKYWEERKVFDSSSVWLRLDVLSGQWQVWRGAAGMDSFKRLWECLLLSLCAQMWVYASEFSARCFTEKGFCRSTRQGEVYGHREKVEHRAPLLFSALGCIARPGVGTRVSGSRHYARERWRGLILG